MGIGGFFMSYPYYQNPYAYLPQQQTITTQPPIMQPQMSITKMIPVSTREEATGTPVDLVSGSPTFFYNKSNGEVYLKQFDVQKGTAIKTYHTARELYWVLGGKGDFPVKMFPNREILDKEQLYSVID